MEYQSTKTIRDGNTARCEQTGNTLDVFLTGEGRVTIHLKPARQRGGLEPCREKVDLTSRYTSAASRCGTFYPLRPSQTLWERCTVHNVRTRILNPELQEVKCKDKSVSLYFSGNVSKHKIMTSVLEITEYDIFAIEDITS